MALNDQIRLDENVEEFRAAAYRAIDWIVDFYRDPSRFPVLSPVKPGEIAAGFAPQPSLKGKSFDALLTEFEEKIVPGMTHWNHPAFFAYFAITGSQAGVLGELLSAALNSNGMLWKSSPSITELETVALGWLRDAFGLPRNLFGIINDTASVNSFLGLAAARESCGFDIRGEGMTGKSLPQMRIYCSDQAHSSIEKGALALGFGTRGVTKIASDDAFRMRVDLLERAMADDRDAGVVPVAVIATLGTTSTASVDPLPEIAEIAKKFGAWIHVDAAYAGSATVAPEFRFIWEGIEHADSIVVNPHKWLFTPVDCSVLFTKRPDDLKRTFSLVPEYLKTAESDVINYMDYGIQLGRRFRALKLWMILEHYGLEHLADVIRQHVGYAARLVEALKSRDDIELLAPPSFSVVVFRKVVRREGRVDENASEAATTALLERMNGSGRLFLSHTRLRDRFGIRVAIGNGATQWEHVAGIIYSLDGTDE